MLFHHRHHHHSYVYLYIYVIYVQVSLVSRASLVSLAPIRSTMALGLMATPIFEVLPPPVLKKEGHNSNEPYGQVQQKDAKTNEELFAKIEGGWRKIHGDINEPPPVHCKLCGMMVEVRSFRTHLLMKTHLLKAVAAFTARHPKTYKQAERDHTAIMEERALNRQIKTAQKMIRQYKANTSRTARA